MREKHGGISNTLRGDIMSSISPWKLHRRLLAWLVLEAIFVQQYKRFHTFCPSLDHSDVKVSNKSALAVLVALKQKVEECGTQGLGGA